MTKSPQPDIDPTGAVPPASGEPVGSIACITLGCPKNQVDSEAMLGVLHRAGFRTTTDLAAADVAVINTCSFIEPAREESIETILEVAGRKGKGRLRAIVVAGCLAQRYGAELFGELPEIDAVIGTGSLGEIASVVGNLLRGRRRELRVGPPGAPIGALGARVLSTPAHYAYLKIAEGCDHRCSFCIIPALRGLMRSRPVPELVAEAAELVAGGVRELNLISQDTTAYGRDLALGPAPLVRLLEGLDAIPGIEWIRLLYTHPVGWTDALMSAVADLEHVVPYADMPIQHISERMMRAMRRGISACRVRDVLERLRTRIPGLALRTTILVGHPGETEADQEELLEFLGAFRFERLGVFPFSREENTPAGEAPDQVPGEVIDARLQQVTDLARSIALARQGERVGTTIPVMIDGPGEEGRLLARSSWDAPEVDGSVIIDAIPDAQVAAGTMQPVRIIGCGPHDLFARVAAEVAVPVDATGTGAVRSGAEHASTAPEPAAGAVSGRQRRSRR